MAVEEVSKARGARGGADVEPSLSRRRSAFGDFVTVRLSGPRVEAELVSLADSILAEIARLEGLMSFHDPFSELSRINREAALAPVPVSQEMHEVLAFALRLGDLSSGRFDLAVAPDLVRRGLLPDHLPCPESEGSWKDLRLGEGHVSFRRPMLLDLGGIAKGYAVDRAFALMPEDVSVTVDAGGDVRMRPWRSRWVSVRHPGDERTAGLLDVCMAAPAVATSGGHLGELGHPVVDLLGGTGIRDGRSVTVFAPTCMVAHALTKVVFLEPACAPLLKELGAAALIIGEGGDPRWIQAG